MRLWLKFLLATSVVIAMCLILVGVMAGSIIRQRFDSYVRNQQRSSLQQIIPFLVNYYERSNGNWTGLQQSFEVRRGRGLGQGAGVRILVLDTNRQVVADTQGDMLGQVVPESTWAAGVPITVQDREVGRVINETQLTAGARQRDQLERSFLASMVSALLGASLVGAFAAIVVATILALQLTAPARKLTQAAQRFAAGDMHHRVSIRSRDELGQVGDAFNDMASALADQEELRRHMVADIAHELRTPLTVMQVELESLQDGLAEPTPEGIASLSEEVGLLSRLVEDLRLLSLVEAGQLTLEMQPVSLVETLHTVVQQVSTSAERKEVILETSVSPELPDVRVDPNRLHQVLLNLISNALRHTPAGGRVHLSAHAEGDQLHLQVADSGEGISPQDLPHIFDRFFRADASRSRTTGGSGLGLTIARGLVEAMGGRMWAESSVGRGTTIHLTLLKA